MKKLLLPLAVVLTSLALGEERDAPHWPQWGGPTRDFHAESVGLARTWPDGGPKKLWSRALGEGYSTIVSDGYALYTMYRIGEDEIVVSLDASTGTTRWERRYHAPLLEHMGYGTWLRQGGAGPYSTPLIYGDVVYSVGTTGKFHALDRHSGDVVWYQNLVEPSRRRGSSGFASSPVVYDGKIMLPVGGRGQGVVAFDPADGGVVWKNQDFRLAPASPIVIHVDGESQLVVFSTEEVVGLDPDNGNRLWSHRHETNYGLNISTPVWGDGNLLFVSSAYNGGSRVIRIGDDKPEELWSSNRLRLHFGNAIRIGDLILGSSGDFGPAFFIAVDVETGEEAWRERTFGRAQMVYADGKLVIVDEGGDIALATADASGLVVHARAELLTENAWTAPTLVGTHLYVRDRRNIVAVDLGE